MSDPWSFSYWVTSLTGGIHILAAFICLVLGPIIFFNQKGTARHKLMGKIWIVCMLIVDIAALCTYELNGRPNLFHAFAFLNLITLTPAFLFIKKYQKTKNPKDLVQHRGYMAWTYFGLLAAGIWQIIISLARVGVLNMAYKYLYNGLGALTLIASISLFIYLRKLDTTSPSS